MCGAGGGGRMCEHINLVSCNLAGVKYHPLKANGYISRGKLSHFHYTSIV